MADDLDQSNTLPDPLFIEVIDKAVEVFPDSFSLLAQRSTLHKIAGELDKATELLAKAILMAPGKFFLWSKMASLINPETDLRLHVSFLYKALCVPGPEQYKGKIRLSLAEALISKRLYAEALRELDKVTNIYEANGWHISSRHTEMRNRIPPDTIASDPEHIYRRVANMAEDMLYSSLPSVSMKKTYHKEPDLSRTPKYGKPTPAWRITDENGANVWFSPERFNIPAHLPLGTILSVKLYNGKVVHAEIR